MLKNTVDPTALSKATWLLGNFKKLTDTPPKSLVPFSRDVVELLDNMSHILIGGKSAAVFPEVIAFAFWCRKASVFLMQKPYLQELNHLIGRGMVFHIAPSNVPVNFAYSLTAGLLAGNRNVVRVPSKDFAQVNLIVEALREALTKTPSLIPYLLLCRYDHDTEINDALSSLCDVRVIWGGDETIRQIRQSLLPPRAVELCFADRYSICVIDADEYLLDGDADEISRGFYNDTFLSDQNACTSPRLVVWIGNETAVARQRFWDALHRHAGEKYQFQPIQAARKLHTLFSEAALQGGFVLQPMPDNLIFRAETPSLTEHTLDRYGDSGYFIEYVARNFEEILPVCSGKCQTVSFFGIDPEKLLNLIRQSGAKGGDRIVPIGQTMQFGLEWDGYDLIRSMSRIIHVPNISLSP